MTNKHSMSFSDDDFGFTFADHEDITKDVVQPYANENQELTDRIQQMYNAIIPLLRNLNANPKQEFIKWPNRTAKIKQFKERLDKIGGSSIQTEEL